MADKSPVPAGTPKKAKTVEDGTPKKKAKTVEDKDKKDDKKQPTKTKQKTSSMMGSVEPLFGSKESTVNLSKESTFEYEDFDVRTLEKDAVDVDSMPSMPTTDFLNAAEFSARDQEDEKLDPKAAFKKKLYRVIKTLTKKKYAGNYYPFLYNDLVKTIKLVKTIMIKEPTVMKCKAPAVIVGDLHGQYVDLLRIFSAFTVEGTPGYLTNRYVFLGDYVDRGKQSLEVLMLCFFLKIACPSQFILLRGNHEFRAINRSYGFLNELQTRFPKGMQADILYEQFNDVFMHFPLCCLIADNILCMHGGISSKMTSREELFKLRKPLRDSKDDPIACDLMWADPMIGLKGEVRNHVRGVSIYFGDDQLNETMKALNVSMVVRGHQMMQNGFNFFNGHKLATVFSASSYYPDRPNKGAVMVITKEGRVGFKTFSPLPKDHPAIKGGQSFISPADLMSEVTDGGGHAVYKPDGAKPDKSIIKK